MRSSRKPVRQCSDGKPVCGPKISREGRVDVDAILKPSSLKTMILFWGFERALVFEISDNVR